MMPRHTLKSLAAEVEFWKDKHYAADAAASKRIKELNDGISKLEYELMGEKRKFNDARDTWNRWLMAHKGEADASGELGVVMKLPAMAHWHPTDFQRLIDMFPVL